MNAKNRKISDATQALWRAANALHQAASPEHFAFILNNLLAHYRARGIEFNNPSKIPPKNQTREDSENVDRDDN